MHRQPPWIASSCWLVVALGVVTPAAAIDWPEWLGERRDGVWRETGLLTKFPPGGPKVVWRAKLGPGYSGPAVAGGRVFVMDRQSRLTPEGKPVADAKGFAQGTERLVCLDASTGRPVWVHEYESAYRMSYPGGPRTTPLVRDGRVYMLGAMGHLKCLDAATGSVRWEKNLQDEYHAKVPVWGWSSCPLLDGDTLYCLVGGDGSAVVAFHKDTGKELWKALSAQEIGYSPPVIIQAGGTRQLIVWHGEAINSLDPATGKLYWSHDYPTQGKPQRPAPTIVQPRLLGDCLFIASFYHGPMTLKLATDKPAAEVLRPDQVSTLRRPLGLHSLMATPVLHAGHVYGVCAMGQLRCCELASGKQLWETLALFNDQETDCGTAFLIPQGDRYVIFTDQGELRLAELSPQGYKEIDRAKIIEPTEAARGRMVVWSHPAFADRKVFVRNMNEMVCVSLAAEPAG